MLLVLAVLSVGWFYLQNKKVGQIVMTREPLGLSVTIPEGATYNVSGPRGIPGEEDSDWSLSISTGEGLFVGMCSGCDNIVIEECQTKLDPYDNCQQEYVTIGGEEFTLLKPKDNSNKIILAMGDIIVDGSGIRIHIGAEDDRAFTSEDMRVLTNIIESVKEI